MSDVKFSLPTLVTLTAPTCAGKSYLLEALVNQFGFDRIVSTTDRQPRDGEIEGVHYNFINTDESKRLEASGDLAELITYNGVRYGVTHKEMASKMQSGHPPIVILEPKGLEIYRQYCKSKGWQLFSIYVDAPESVRLQRLVERTTNDIWQALMKEQFGQIRTSTSVYDLIRNGINVNNRRLKAVLDQERSWRAMATWDAVLDGTNLEAALGSLKKIIAGRNSRIDIYK